MHPRLLWPFFGLILVACGPRGHVEAGLFFPTWDASGGVPTGIVQGILVEEDRCLFVEANGQRTLVLWEAGMGYEDGTLFDRRGDPIVRVGELIHGGGGYYGDRAHMERLSGESIPERCILGGDGDRFAIAYEVVAGPFT